MSTESLFFWQWNINNVYLDINKLQIFVHSDVWPDHSMYKFCSFIIIVILLLFIAIEIFPTFCKIWLLSYDENYHRELPVNPGGGIYADFHTSGFYLRRFFKSSETKTVRILYNL